MRSAYVIELLGAAASGKSGLAAELARDPGTVVVKHHTRQDVPVLAWGLARAWPVLLADPPPGTSRIRWAAWAGRLAAAPSVVRRRAAAPGGLVVLDQGPAYSLGRLIDVRRDPRGNHWWHRQVCATARLLDVLVVLDAEPGVLGRRLHARPKEHPAALLDADATWSYLRAEQALCRTVADAIARAGTRVLHLDTGRLPVDEQVRLVRDAVPASRPGTGRPA